MAGRDQRTVVVRKRVTFLLLLLVTLSMFSMTISLSGKTYKKVDPVPFREVRLLYQKFSEGHVAMPILVALVMPMLLNTLLFLPWGFLLFLLLDSPDRPAYQSYLITLILALGLSAFVEAWQYFLPTRVTDINDVIWNGAGAVAGALLGHLRKRIRFAFE